MLGTFLGTFFEISSTNTAAILGYAGDLVADFMPLLVVLVGILVGIFVISAIARLIR